LNGFLIFILTTFFISPTFASTIKQIERGNLAFPTSQNPSPLFSLGQNIVDKNDLLLLETWNQMIGKQRNYETASSSILYGVNDNFSLLAVIPAIPEYKENHIKKSGVGDLTAQAEWAWFNHDRFTYSVQSTFIFNITLPTGNPHITPLPDRNPNLGFGAPSVFLGATLDYLSVDWYAFIDGGAIITTRHNCTKFGNQYYYEAGVGYRLGSTRHWLFNLILELNGVFYERDSILGQTNTVSGGNVIFLGPSFYAASKKHFIFIAGVQGPITQTLQGVFMNSFRYAIYGAWKY
jgi:hypothetical protein